MKFYAKICPESGMPWRNKLEGHVLVQQYEILPVLLVLVNVPTALSSWALTAQLLLHWAM